MNPFLSSPHPEPLPILFSSWTLHYYVFILNPSLPSSHPEPFTILSPYPEPFYILFSSWTIPYPFLILNSLQFSILILNSSLSSSHPELFTILSSFRTLQYPLSSFLSSPPYLWPKLNPLLNRYLSYVLCTASVNTELNKPIRSVYSRFKSYISNVNPA